MTDVLTLQEAERLTGIPRATWRRWCESGDCVGVKARKGTRTIWQIPRSEAIRMEKIRFSDHRSDHPDEYRQLRQEWMNQQASGYLTGKPIGARGLQANEYGMAKFWEYLRGITLDRREKNCRIIVIATGEILQEKADRTALETMLRPVVSDVTPENLRLALSNVPIDYQGRNCHFAQRDQIFKAVSSFYKLLAGKGLRSSADFEEIRRLKPKRIFPARKTVLQEDQLVHLVEVNDSWLSGRARTGFDQALTKSLVFLFAYAGLRRGEAIALRMEHVDLSNGVLSVIDGKGHKNRQIGICPELDRQLRIWLHEFRPDSPVTNLLVQEDGSPITRDVINKRIEYLANRARVDITPHGLRRTFATLMENRGMPWSLMQISLGHSDIKTTQGYILSDQRKAIDWLRARPAEEPREKLTQAQKLALIDDPLDY
jgi:integrase